MPVSRARQREALFFLTNEWIEKSYPTRLAFFVVHEDKEHYHAHIMLSANEIGAKEKPRMTTREFNWGRAEFEL
ncbi:hypothetical protein N9C35_02170 [Flavobacteriaceae bacterium]|nr:hypothetical protein [Flavobacteriaceae bacterium]